MVIKFGVNGYHPTGNAQTDWDYFYGVVELSDGSFVAAGFGTFGSSTLSHQGWIVKVNSSGNEIWNKNYGGDYWQRIYKCHKCCRIPLSVASVKSVHYKYCIWLPLVDFGNFGGSVTFFGTGNNPIDVGVMTDPSDASTFQLIEEVAITSDFTEYTVGIPNTGTGYIAFKHSNINSVQVLFVDQVSFAQVTPVELTSFTATVNENNEVVLTWKTSTETNNRGFEVQRSEVGGQRSEWLKAGYIAGSGTTTEPRAYSFTDNNVNSGKYSYRLKQIDYDGTYEYSNEVEAEVNMPNEYSLSQNYPNPFNPSTRINFTLPVNSEVTLKIYNALGEEVRTLINKEMTSGRHEIDFRANNMVSGVYFYRLDAKGNDNTNYHSVKKMLLVK